LRESTGDTPPRRGTAHFPVVIIDKQIILAGSEVTLQEQNATEICLLYASAAARAELEDDKTNPKAFFDALIRELSNLGFAVTASREAATSKIFDLTEALPEIAGRYLGHNQLEAFNAVNYALQTGLAPEQTLDILRNWWMSNSANGCCTVVMWGMITQNDGQPSLTLFYLAFNQSVATGPSSGEGFDLTSTAITLALDMSIYKAEEPSLRARLGGAINEYIRHVTLQLTILN
jgi:hypothetical protein